MPVEPGDAKMAGPWTESNDMTTPTAADRCDLHLLRAQSTWAAEDYTWHTRRWNGP